MLWCQGAQNIGLSNHKLNKSTLNSKVQHGHNKRPFQTDGRTDIRTNIMAIARQFVLWTHCALKIKNTCFIAPFYPNVTTLRSGLCYRKSVCDRLSVVCLSVCLSVCNVVAPYSGVEAFGNISSPLCTLAILWPPCKILWRSSQGNPSVVCVKRKSGSKIEWRWTYRRLYLINGTR